MIHLSYTELRSYVNRRLGPADIARVLDHIGECQLCADQVTEFRRSTEPVDSEVDEQDLVRLVSGGLNAGERRRVEAHLHSCRECTEMVSDLDAYRNEITRIEGSRRLNFPVRWMLAAAAAVLAVFSTINLLRPAQPPKPVLLASLEDVTGLIGVTTAGELIGLPAAPDQQLVESALRTGTLASQAARVAPTEVQRGTSAAAPGFKLQYPVGDRVFSVRPRFEWSELPGAAAYEVQVYDSNFNEMARSGRLAAHTWEMQAVLERGKTYVWQVIAYRGGAKIAAPVPPEPEARFDIVNPALANRIEKAHAARSHLLLAALYASEGLRREALIELDSLAPANPNSATLESLRQSLR